MQKCESSSVGTGVPLPFVHCKRSLMSNARSPKRLKGPGTLHPGAPVCSLASSHTEFGLRIRLLNKPGYAQPVLNGKNLAKL